MNDSWIAIADESGLKSLVLEQEHTACFASRRAARENASCFWVVLTPQHAGFINQQLCIGAPADALAWLEKLATGAGRITPSKPLVPHWLSDHVTIPDQRDRDWSN